LGGDGHIIKVFTNAAFIKGGTSGDRRTTNDGSGNTATQKRQADYQ